MAHAFILDFDGGTAAQYDAVIEEMGLHGQMAPHGIVHAAGPTATGWRVIDVWDSPEAFEKFAQEKIGPISAHHGLPEPRVTGFPVAQTRRGGPGEAGFVQTVTLAAMDQPGFTAMDEQVLKGGELPAECVYHVNGPLGDSWIVADAWTTKEARDEFVEHNIAPAMQAAGEVAMPAIDDFPVHNALTAVARATT